MTKSEQTSVRQQATYKLVRALRELIPKERIAAIRDDNPAKWDEHVEGVAEQFGRCRTVRAHLKALGRNNATENIGIVLRIIIADDAALGQMAPVRSER